MGGVLPSGTLTFSQGVTAQSITVRVAGDTTVESDEVFQVALSVPTTGFGTITQGIATGTILNDDVAAPGGTSGGTTPVGSPIATPPVGNTPTPVITPSSNNTSTSLPPPVIAFDPNVSVSDNGVTLAGTVSAAAGVQYVELIQVKKNGIVRDLGSADVSLDASGTTGTWSFDYNDRAGFHTNLEAVAVGNDGQQAVALSHYNLTTGIENKPFAVVQDSYDAKYNFEGQSYFKSGGKLYYHNVYSASEDGVSYTYPDGTFFDNKSYSSFVDTYMNDSIGQTTIATHVENNDDGSHLIDVEGSGLFVVAINNDVFKNFGTDTTFVFGRSFGQEGISNFEDGAVLKLEHNGSARLAEALATAKDSGGNAVLNFGHGDTVTLDNVAVADLQQKHNTLFKT